LKGGEAIVVNGLQRVKPGDRVTPQKTDMLETDKPSAVPGKVSQKATAKSLAMKSAGKKIHQFRATTKLASR